MMLRMSLTVTLWLCFLVNFCLAQLTDDPSELLSWCLDGRHHKEKPGPEGELFSQCTPWKNRSCCTYNTTKNLHETKMYNFDYNHCSAVKNMSESCKRHFTQDHCFYECSPNIGPWVVKVNMKTRKERFYQVPLCASDCEAWFSACRDEYTCTDNWMRNFVWENGTNKCLPGSECRTFRQVYRTADNFCQKVWDDAWKVMKDSEACMRLWFDGSGGNPNDNVARLKVQELTAVSGGGLSAVLSLTAVYSLLPLLLTVR
ncbi:LOW QUALITY PROTEIN: folate receptor beta-like [Homalodisca vitripennis]|uniref:LOW QUALITY PROTEIN: folate receptor beta-like n=1 Tax=Homalodisca vitripennis TaxID=197043 RepID=UPI001EE9C364|nr:LOW QUALITY PROTEIN: folate receptor beta-like [Homalodisca vitripennis]